MKKVINITIGGVVFQIEEDAYQNLQEYLKKIAEHFSKNEESEEILEDIEISIAEKFEKRQKTHKKTTSPINHQDVEKIISELGTVEDFQEIEKPSESKKNKENQNNKESERTNSESTNSKSTNSESETKENSDQNSPPKKLYRDPNDKILGGVCSGIAAYVSWDSTIVRLILIACVFLGGFGFFIYIILWIIVPQAETTTQKLEMKGEKVTLKKIETVLKEGVEKLKKKTPKNGIQKLSQAFEKVSRAFEKVLKVVVNIFRFIIGIALTIAMILAIFFITLAGTTLIYSGQILFTNLFITSFIPVSGPLFIVFILSIYFTILIPLVTILIASLSLIRWKNLFNNSITIVFIILWTLSLAVSSAIIIDHFPEIELEIKELEADRSFRFHHL